MKTILITGCSSGFGLETARYFLERDWNVIATMRAPRADLLPASSRLRVLPLDVNDADSIARLIEAAGPIDVLVNNAGIGALGALEGIGMSTVSPPSSSSATCSVRSASAVPTTAIGQRSRRHTASRSAMRAGGTAST